MATGETAEEMKLRCIEKMGPELGAQYAELWQRVVRINIYWGEYVELFGSKIRRIELLNKAAPQFFHMLQDELWDVCLLHIARLTDKPQVSGQRNLTICNLPRLTPEGDLREVVSGLVGEALDKTNFCRSWRNLRIAHDDLLGALKDTTARELAGGSRVQVKLALEAIGAVMNAINLHYFDAETLFRPPGFRPNGAVHLMYLLRDGLKMAEQKQARIRAGDFHDDDFNFEEV